MKCSIGDVLAADERIGLIATSEASFLGITEMLGSLSLHKYGDLEEVQIILKAIRQAEDLRNQLFHSNLVGMGADEMLRRKWSAKAKKGVTLADEIYSAQDLIDVAEWIDKIATVTRGFFLIKIIEEGKNSPVTSQEIQGNLLVTRYANGTTVVTDA